MRAVMVMFDSLNRHFLPPYGSSWVHAPNFSRLAERTVTFDRNYAGSLPCIPARRELHTGRYNFLHRAWGPLEPFDDSMPERLKNCGVHTHLTTDHQHYWEDGGATYHTRYSTWEFARGQEGDPWKGQVADPIIPPVPVVPHEGPAWRQDWVNRQHMATLAAHPQTRTFDSGLEFIETNHDQDNWFLQIETFDPHEPFFSNPAFHDLYPDDYSGPHFDWPAYRRVSEPDEVVQHARLRYAALLSMCDNSLGRVLDMMDRLDMWDDTMLIVCTDHGFLLGEHGWWAKMIQPCYEEVTHTPLFIWDPRTETRGERRDSLVQTIDIAPTLLEFFNVDRPKDMHGVPLSDTIAHDAPVRDAGLFGIFGQHVNVTDGRYVYMRSCAISTNQPLREYTLMPTRMRSHFALDDLSGAELAEPFEFTKGVPTLRTPGKGPQGAESVNPYQFGTLLFDLETDPAQERPIVDEAVERRMIGHLIELMQANDAPPEQYERLGLPADGVAGAEHLDARDSADQRQNGESASVRQASDDRLGL